MSDKIVVTGRDVEDKSLLLRLLRKISDSDSSIKDRLGRIERLPAPPTYPEIRNQLQATGVAPLNIQSLPGLLQQPQLASAPRSTTAPTGQILQQFGDTQLVLVGSTSTGFALNTVVGGNPNVLYQLIGSLTTASVGSTSTNLMTLDTVQTVTSGGIKTINAPWTFSTNEYVFGRIGINTTAPAQLLDLHTTSATNDVFITMGVDATVGPAFNFGYGGASLGRSGCFFNVRPDTGAASPNPSIRFLTANTERFRADATGLVVSGNQTLSGTITNYHSISTTGEGVPYILSRDAQISKTSSVGVTTLYTTTTTGEYRLSYYLECNTTGTSIPTFNYFYNNDAASLGISSTGLAMTSAGSNEQKTLFLRSASGAGISYSVAFTTATSTSPGTYSIFTLLERLT